jgi:hypothetical protein
MAKYVLLLHDGATPVVPDPELFDRFVQWTNELHQKGKLAGVERLGDRGKTLKKRGAEFVVDGPFAEGKEAVLGLFVIEAADDTEALAIAQGCPALDVGGSVEVRLVSDFPNPMRASS